MTHPAELRRWALRLQVIALLAWTALASMACSEARPAWCSDGTPPDASCVGAHCVLAVVIDYRRLEPRGHRVYALSGDPIDRATAEKIAMAHIVDVLDETAPDQSDCIRADDFFHCGLSYPAGDRYLVIINAETGTVLFAEKEIWAVETGRDQDGPLPAGFAAASTVCVDPITEPTARKLVVTGAPGPLDAPTPLSAPEQALETARQLGLTRQFLEGKPYRALVISYASAIGEFDGEVADWYVWFYRQAD